MEKPNIAAIGEILWDLLPTGPTFGGAPANFAHHAAALGGQVAMISAVGNDSLGSKAIDQLQVAGLNTAHVQVIDGKNTGAVDVEIDGAGNATYSFRHDEAWDHLGWNEQLEKLASEVDAVCFGTLAQRGDVTRETIKTFLEKTPSSALKIFDVNLRPPFDDDALIDASLKLTDVLKLNDEELSRLATTHAIDGDEVTQAKRLAEMFQLRLVAVTRGERGGLLVCGDDVSEMDALPVPIEDTVGAGDSFSAALTLGILHGVDLDEINQYACRIAEFVCSQSGATPELPDTLKSGWL